jgi:hypothetical protein
VSKVDKKEDLKRLTFEDGDIISNVENFFTNYYRCGKVEIRLFQMWKVTFSYNELK